MPSNVKDFLRHAALGVATAAALAAANALGAVDWSTLGAFGPIIASIVHAGVSAVNSSLRAQA